MPEGWRIVRRLRDGRVCAIRQPVTETCPPGTRKFANTVPAGWRIVKRLRNGRVCAERITPICPNGWKQVSRAEVNRLRGLGWQTRRIAGGIWCVKPPIEGGVICRGGQVADGRCICPPGLAPVLIGQKGQFRIYKCRIQHCPPGMVRKGDHCVPRVQRCPPGMKRVGNRCVRIPRRCKPGFVRRDGRCVPRVLPCPQGMVRKGRRCVRKLPAKRPHAPEPGVIQPHPRNPFFR